MQTSIAGGCSGPCPRGIWRPWVRDRAQEWHSTSNSSHPLLAFEVAHGSDVEKPWLEKSDEMRQKS